jgi:hypothetical protein
MNDRKIADAVNEIRDMAVKYRDTQQLRDRIASLMTTILRAQDVARAPLTDEQRIAIQECIGYLTPAAKEFSDLGLPGMGDSKHARCIRTLQSILAHAAPAVAPTEAFQARVHPWMIACFGAAIATDAIERNHRFFEEAAELVQACGMTASEAHQLVDYTWSRPVGEKNQEAGGVMVTLAALCLAQGLDMHAAGETELARISAPETMAKIRAKQAAKPKHSPLPESAPAQAEQQGDGGARSWRADVQKVLDALDPDDWCGDESMISALTRALSASDQPSARDYLDTLTAVLNAIGYKEEFAAAHLDLKVSDGVKLFLAKQRGAIECQAHIGPDCTECGGTGFWESEQPSACVALSEDVLMTAIADTAARGHVWASRALSNYRAAILAASAAQTGESK